MTNPNLAVVQAPPATVPPVGLIAALGPVGGVYLDPPDTFDGFTLPPFSPETPWPAPPEASLMPQGGEAALLGPPQRSAGGVRWLPEQKCTVGAVQDPCAPDMTSTPGDDSVVEAASFLVWDGDYCSTFGWQAHDFVGRSVRELLSVESYQIAQELWTGTQAQASGWPNHYLANNSWADVLSAGSALAPAQALDVLEQGLAQCGHGQRGMIHCTPQLGSFLSGLGNTLRTVNGLIITYRGTIIVADAGYDGSGPDGQPASGGSQWAYATLMPVVRRGPIEVIPGSYEEAVDRHVNKLEWRAQRWANVSFPDCCHLAAQVDLPLALVGGAS